MASIMSSDASEPLKVYWQPGCSSCLRTKEFLTRRNVRFVSVNVLEDARGFEELAQLGVRRVPIVSRGKAWVDGQVLADVARLAHIDWRQPRALAPDVLAARIVTVLAVARALLAQIPDDCLDMAFSQRRSTYRQHGRHIFRVVQAFLDLVEGGQRLEFSAYDLEIPPEIATRSDLERFNASVAARFERWRLTQAMHTDYAAPADVYYGEQTVHEFLERTASQACRCRRTSGTISSPSPHESEILARRHRD
jgi:glutaredoxin